MNKVRYCLAAVISLSVVLIGCASSSSMPEDHYYRLSQINNVNKISATIINETLVVERVKAYGIYHERAMLYAQEDSPETLKYHHYHYWIDKPAVLVREQFIRYLRDAAVAQHVVESEIRQHDGIMLNLELKNFERELHNNGEVFVRISLGLRTFNTKRNTPIFSQDYTEIIKADDGSMAATVRAFNIGLADIYQKLSNDLISSVESI